MIETIESELQLKRPRGRPPLPDPLEQLQERIAHWAYRLKLANEMRAGLMDSESRHSDVAAQRYAIIESVVNEMKE
jgi:hypothetical protein